MLQNENILAKIGFDTAENKLPKLSMKMKWAFFGIISYPRPSPPGS